MEPVTKEQLEKLNKNQLVELAGTIDTPGGDEKLTLPLEMKKDVMIQTILTTIEVFRSLAESSKEISDPCGPGSQDKAEDPPELDESKTAAEKYPHSIYPDPETVSQEKLEEMAAKWHTGPDDVRVILVETERKRQELAAAEARQKEIAIELKKPLSETEKERMAELEAKASGGRGHPDPVDMLWLSRARVRLLITPLNPREARRLADLEADETATLIKEGTPEAAELKSLRQRPE